MIEVEKKFIPNPEEIERVIRDAEFLGEESHADTYYDLNDYSLTAKVTWLRTRDGRFELKVPLNWKPHSHGKIIQFNELNMEDDIRGALGIDTSRTLKEDLQNNGYYPFVTFTTSRRKYKKGELYFVLDTTSFGLNILEIELMVNDESEIKEAEDKILAFAEEHGFSQALDTGKVVEWIRRNKPEHYQTLINAGVAQ